MTNRYKWTHFLGSKSLKIIICSQINIDYSFIRNSFPSFLWHLWARAFDSSPMTLSFSWHSSGPILSSGFSLRAAPRTRQGNKTRFSRLVALILGSTWNPIERTKSASYIQPPATCPRRIRVSSVIYARYRRLVCHRHEPLHWLRSLPVCPHPPTRRSSAPHFWPHLPHALSGILHAALFLSALCSFRVSFNF